MYCKKCGTELNSEAKYCKTCGEKVSRVEMSSELKINVDKIQEIKMKCHSCGRENNSEAKFCKYCGTKMDVKESDKIVKESANKKKIIFTAGILAVLVVCLLTGVTVKRTQDEKKRLEKKAQREQEEQRLEEEYKNLLKEGDDLLVSDTISAAEKYLEATKLIYDREEGYLKLLDLYIKDYRIPETQNLLTKIEMNISSPSAELQALIDGEKQKKWYLAKSRITLYDINIPEGAAKPVAGQLTTSLVSTNEYYYKYDSQGRLIESNAGSLPSIYSKNDGTYRVESSLTKIDSDLFAKRAGEDADYILLPNYNYPDDIDASNVFTYEYSDDGSVVEKAIVDGQVTYVNRYRFNDKVLLSQDKLNVSDGSVRTSYNNIQLHGDYVSYNTDGKTRYWEESYGSEGKLNKFMLELPADSLVFSSKVSFNNGKTMSEVKLNYSFNDIVDKYGNISQRTLKFDIVGGALGGRRQDGTYYEWATLQEGILRKNIEYKYIYCKEDEINQKIEEYSNSGYLQW